jgi:hypothetical protein
VSLIKLRKIFSVKNDIAVLVDASSKATKIGSGLDDKRIRLKTKSQFVFGSTNWYSSIEIWICLNQDCLCFSNRGLVNGGFKSPEH